MKHLLPSLLLTLSLQTLAQPANDTTFGYTTSADGVQIVYQVAGNGPTAIFLVHGWSCDRTYWSGQTQAFKKEYKVITVDLAGHGGSGTGRKVYSMESFGADVAAVVEKLRLPKVVLVGHSMGGDVIAEAARLLPGRVTGLIMVDTYKKIGPGRSPEEVEAIVARVRTHFRDSAKVLVKSMFVATADQALVEKISEDMSSAPPDIALSAMEHALHYSRQMPLTLEELKLPVIAINPDNSATDLASMKKNGVEVMIMKGVGHFLPQEDVVGFNKILTEAVGKME